MKKRLADLFRHEAIKAEFDRSFSFIQALTMKANQIRNLVSDNEDDNAEVSQSVKIDSKEVDVLLNNTYRFIDTYIDDVAGQIAQSVHHWVSAQIASAIRLPKKEDPDVVIDAQLIEVFVRLLLNFISRIVRGIYGNIFYYFLKILLINLMFLWLEYCILIYHLQLVENYWTSFVEIWSF